MHARAQLQTDDKVLTGHGPVRLEAVAHEQPTLRS
jgi:hypothetical protein